MIYKTRIRIEDFDKNYILENEIEECVNNLSVGDRLQSSIKIIKKGHPENADFIICTGEIVAINNALAKEFYSNKDELIRVIVMKPDLECVASIKEAFSRLKINYD